MLLKTTRRAEETHRLCCPWLLPNQPYSLFNKEPGSIHASFRLDPNHHSFKTLVLLKGSYVLIKHSIIDQSLNVLSQEKKTLEFLSFSLPLPGLAPHFCLSPRLSISTPLFSPSIPLPFQARYLFSEPQNPSQASDIYSLELEYFLFLFPRVKLTDQISPGFLPALPEVKC